MKHSRLDFPRSLPSWGLSTETLHAFYPPRNKMNGHFYVLTDDQGFNDIE